MKRTSFFILSIGMLCTASIYAQNDIDVMRYSQLTFGGTARFSSMSGAMGALGGDISTLSFNPAGIAVFRKSELSISPSIFSQTTSSTYLNVNSTDARGNFNLGNIGLVATFRLRDTSSGWQLLNFGFGYNRTNNFNNRINITGVNKTSSLLDTYAADATGQLPSTFDQFSTDLAYQAYLINPLPTDTTKFNHVIKHYGEQQNKSIESAGGMGETVLSFGGNYRNRLFLGVTTGFVNVRYTEQSIFTETDVKDTIKGFKSFSLTQNLYSKGSGVNLKIGMILKATDWLRIGAAVHTPTRISMKDSYSNSIVSDLESRKEKAESPQGNYNYFITTPFRAIGSLGFVIGKRGLINADYEYVNYKNARLNSSPNVFSEINSFIREEYRSTGNVRVGGEIRLDPFSLRGGYALYGSPFARGKNMDAKRSAYTIGLGFRKNAFFIDFATVVASYKDYSYLYDPSFNNAVVENHYLSLNFLFTFGFRF